LFLKLLEKGGILAVIGKFWGNFNNKGKPMEGIGFWEKVLKL